MSQFVLDMWPFGAEAQCRKLVRVKLGALQRVNA